jgi:predicted dehydrogenase
MQPPVRWGILGPGSIAGAFARDLRQAPGAQIAAVGSRALARAQGFARDHRIPRAHGGYAELVADPDVDAVYVATPHSHHAEHTILALDAGKHVLCEKPMATSATEVARMIDAARRNGRTLTDAMWTRFIPVMTRVRGILDAGEIGRPHRLVADFGFRAEFDPQGRLFNPDLAGGALLDVGVYPVSLASWLFGEPTVIHSSGFIGPTGVDYDCSVFLEHAGGELALLSASLIHKTGSAAIIEGAQGRIRIHAPWWAGSRMTVSDRTGREQHVNAPKRGLGFSHEAEAFQDLVRTGRPESPVMPWAESQTIARTMDVIRERWRG